MEYTGAIFDSSNGFYDDRARFYDPSAKGGHEFLSQDPLGGGYAYAADSAASFVDPTGMAAKRSSGGGFTPPYMDPCGTTFLQPGHGRSGGGCPDKGGVVNTQGNGGPADGLSLKCVALWGYLAFVVIGAIVGFTIGAWAVASGATNLEAAIGVSYATVMYGYVGRFATAVIAGDVTAMVASIVPMILAAALVFLAGLGFFEAIGWAATWAAKTAGWPLLLVQIGLALASALAIIYLPGGLKDSGCMG